MYRSSFGHIQFKRSCRKSDSKTRWGMLIAIKREVNRAWHIPHFLLAPNDNWSTIAEICTVPFVGYLIIFSSVDLWSSFCCLTGPLLLRLLSLILQGSRHHSPAISNHTKLKCDEKRYCLHLPTTLSHTHTQTQVKMHHSFNNVLVLCFGMCFQRDAVATSHCSQPNNVEYEMAMEWCLHQARSEQAIKMMSKVIRFDW